MVTHSEAYDAGASHCGRDAVMDTDVTQCIFGPCAKSAYGDALSLLRALEARMSRFREGSDIYRLNAAAGNGIPVPLHCDTLRVLIAAREYRAASEGAFDPASATLTDCWRRAERRDAGMPQTGSARPDAHGIGRALALADADSLCIDEPSGTAMIRNPGTAIDLGGIAKGYAADAAVALYKRRGIRSALIDLGGNVKALGAKPGGMPWRIGLQHPRKQRGELFGIVQAKDASVVTSGGYERFFAFGGERRGHIIDMRTGHPADSGLISVTVIAKCSMRADALSTAIYALGARRGRRLLAGYPDAEAILVDDRMDVWLSPGIARGNSSFVFMEAMK